MSRVYDEALASHGITTAQFAILRLLSRDADMPLSRLARTLVMDRTTLYRALAPIERNGWIEIRALDARSKELRLTVAGADIRARATRSWERVQDRVTDAIGGSEWAAFEAKLANLTRIVAEP